MTAFEALRNDGWRVDQVKFRESMGDSFDEKLGKDELKKILSNLDIKDYGEAFLSEAIANKSMKGPMILQLTKWENVSFPKINEHILNDCVCSLILTDGAKSIKSMATEPLSNISGETPYGSKILLTGNLKMEKGILQLNPKNCKFLGGTVEKLVEKWKTERFSSKKDASDAPKWSSIAATGTSMLASTIKKERDTSKAVQSKSETKASVNNNESSEAVRQHDTTNVNGNRSKNYRNNGSSRNRNGGGGGGRGAGGGRPAAQSFSNPFVHGPPPMQQFQNFQPNPQFMFPPAHGYVPPMPRFVSNQNPSIPEVGKQVLAPFIDNNYYPAMVCQVDEAQGLTLVQYAHHPIPHFVHTEYLQLFNAQV